MRSIEYLIQLFPDKTGREILEIQKQDKIIDKKESNKRNKKKLDLIKDYNSKGAYFKSTFGLNQYRYDSFTDLKIDERGRIMCNVESIIGFSNDFQIEIEVREYKNLDKYIPQERDRIKKREYNLLKDYLNNIFPKFWGLIDKSKF